MVPAMRARILWKLGSKEAAVEAARAFAAAATQLPKGPVADFVAGFEKGEPGTIAGLKQAIQDARDASRQERDAARDSPRPGFQLAPNPGPMPEDRAMKLVLTVLAFVSGVVAMRFLGAVLGALLLTGVAPAPSIWVAAGLFLFQITASGVLIFRHLSTSPPRPPVEGDEDMAEPAPETWDPSVVEAERRDVVLRTLTWWLTLPALIFGVWAWSEPVVGWYHTLRLATAGVIGIGLLLLAWPDRAYRFQPEKRSWVRSALAGLIVLATCTSLYLRHPYLLPGHPDATRLRAERVLAAGNIVTLQHHSGALVDWGRELEAAGQIQKAGELFHLASRCDGTNAGVQEAFADFLKRHGRPGEDAFVRKLAADLRSGAALKISEAPYDLEPGGKLPVYDPARPPTRHVIVLVRDTDTPPALLDILGAVIREELGVEVHAYPAAVEIGGTTRQQGLLAKQISIEDAWAEAARQLPPREAIPHQRLVVTRRDLFAPGANCLYGSVTQPGQGVVSYSRMGNADSPTTDPRLLDSLCKQSLATLIKSLVVYPCPDPRDVTAYVNGGFQLERKGRRPLPATLATYHAQALQWAQVLEQATRGAK